MTSLWEVAFEVFYYVQGVWRCKILVTSFFTRATGPALSEVIFESGEISAAREDDIIKDTPGFKAFRF